MARRPNYGFERAQRQRTKAAKKDAKREARTARKAGIDPASLPPAEPERTEPSGLVLPPAPPADSDAT